VVERVSGARFDLAPVRASFGGALSPWRVEVADVELYGIAGLRASGVRATGLFKRGIASAAATNFVSPVGSHARAVLEAGAVVGNAWQGAVRAGAERLALGGADPLVWRVAGLTSRVDVGRVTTLADVEIITGAGGDATSVLLATRVRAGVAYLAGTVRIDGDRFVGAGVSVTARLHPILALLVGYEDGTGSARAAAVIALRHVEIAAGVFQHPVLGASRGVSVACAR
jgi:hypothetical protein